MAKSLTTSGAFAALLLTSGCMAYIPDAYPPPPPPPRPVALESSEPGQAYRVTPKPNPHRLASRAGGATSKAERVSQTSTSAAEKPATTEDRMADSKPLTPAEIRAAVPLQKVSNPQHTLPDAQIKSLWGDVVGKVRSVDMRGGTLKAVDANLVGDGKVVRIDSARLKYVRSRNVIVTTMSKPDVDKLPSADKL